jgi:phosphate:Na+ symporter
MAFSLLVPYVNGVESLMGGIDDPEIFLVAFHTLFNFLGVVIILPFTARFARAIERLVPEQDDATSRILDNKLLHEPALALSAVGAVLRQIAAREMNALRARLDGKDFLETSSESDLLATRQYLSKIATRGPQTESANVAAGHVIDHLLRLRRRVQALDVTVLDSTLEQRTEGLARLATTVAHWLEQGEAPCPVEEAEKAAATTAAVVKPYRASLLGDPAQLATDTIILRLDMARLLARLHHHLWRITHYLPRLLTPGAIEAPDHVADSTDEEALLSES